MTDTTHDLNDGLETLRKIERTNQGVHVAGIPADISLASIAVSLKRIADHLEASRFDMQQVNVQVTSPVTIKTN